MQWLEAQLSSPIFILTVVSLAVVGLTVVSLAVVGLAVVSLFLISLVVVGLALVSLVSAMPNYTKINTLTISLFTWVRNCFSLFILCSSENVKEDVKIGTDSFLSPTSLNR